MKLNKKNKTLLFVVISLLILFSLVVLFKYNVIIENFL